MYRILGVDQKEYGPVSSEQLRQWIAQGRVNRQTRIKSEGAVAWQTAGELPEFAADLAMPSRVPTASSTDAVPAKTSAMAIVSLVLGVLGLFSCGITALVGLVLGIVALIKIRNSEGRLSGSGVAIAGIVASGLFLLMVPIYAAMLFPALYKAKQRAQTINCVNNVKQLALAVRVYSSDHADAFPSATNWCDAIQKDVGSPKVFQCPADPALRCAFAYNGKLDGKKDSEINPQTVMFFESSAGWNAAGGRELFAAHKHSTTRIVVGFADGSVQQLPRSQLETLRWEP